MALLESYRISPEAVDLLLTASQASMQAITVDAFQLGAIADVDPVGQTCTQKVAVYAVADPGLTVLCSFVVWPS